MKKGNNIEQDKKEIERLLHKSDIKEVNGMDSAEDIDAALCLMSEHGADKEDVDSYVNDYTNTALSLLGEPLSEIPRGRIVQFLSILECELKHVVTAYEECKKQNIEPADFMTQYNAFHAAGMYLSDLLMESGDKETMYIPGLDEIEVYTNMPLIDVGKASLEKHHEVIAHAFSCFDCFISFARQAIENNDTALMSAVSFNIDLMGMYLHHIIDFVFTSNENASDT